mmetsp:Transcript_78236/g.148708  ORF Transcript_78236/g.148708 Transcript_78236/m.148708 type:complete len:204 (-) Transcript_78236:10-621(-)
MPISIFVDTVLSGDRLTTIEMELTDTIQKLRVAAEVASAGYSLSLLFGSTLLEDSLSAADCGLHDKAVVHAVFQRHIIAFFTAIVEGWSWTWRRTDVSIAPGDHAGLEKAHEKKMAGEIKEFDTAEVLAEIELNYMEEGWICGAGGEKDKSEEILALLRNARTAMGFHYEYSTCTHRSDREVHGFGFHVAGHLLLLQREFFVS